MRLRRAVSGECPTCRRGGGWCVNGTACWIYQGRRLAWKNSARDRGALLWRLKKQKTRADFYCLTRLKKKQTKNFPCGSDGKSVSLQCRRPGFDPRVGKIPWRRKWQPTPVFLPEKSHGQRSLVGYSPWGRKELHTTEWLHFLSLDQVMECLLFPLNMSVVLLT